jgi:hypothetical protein
MEEKLWSIRFEISERARKEHKENAATLLKENEKLQGSIQQVGNTPQYTIRAKYNFMRLRSECKFTI